ncbi:MAG TPA: FtsX-like permease family protein, partial [Flavobacteriaceae bacterium]|nr:FtsX-like permease family protein [Flavobacteriaceae bacterium]
AVYLIFTLVLIIGLFNVGGAIVMAILDKRENIKTLYNLGANLRSIQRIFFLQGTLLTLIGGVLGLFVGVIIIFLQQQFGLVMITQNMPYPVILQIDNLIIVFLTIMVLGIVASFIGSTRVSRAIRI